MKFEGRDINDQIIIACRQRMGDSEFERKDLLAILRSFGLSPDLAERIAENLIHEASINGEIAAADGLDHPIWVPGRKGSSSSKTATAIGNKTSITKPKRKPLPPSAQLDLFAGI